MAALAMIRNRNNKAEEREKRAESEIAELIARFGTDSAGLTVPELRECLASLAEDQARAMEASFGRRPEIEKAFGLNRVGGASATDEETAYVLVAAGVSLADVSEDRGTLVDSLSIREAVDTWSTYLWDRPKLKKDFPRFTGGNSTIGASGARAYLAALQLPDEEPPREDEVAELLERFVRPIESADPGLTDVGLYFFARTARRALRNRRAHESGWWVSCARRRS
jgi:hypothetical protein